MKTRTKIPMRQCTGCREMKSKKEMIRVLRTSENEIILDATGKKKTDAAHTFVSQRNAWKRLSKTMAWSVP